MRLEIVERLRCPAPHAATPLVVVAGRVVERELLRGSAGCPVCHAEAQLVEGDAWFGAPPTAPDGARASEAASAPPDDPAGLERLIALLGLADPGGTVLLTGRYASYALHLAATTEVGVVVLGEAPGTPAPGEGPRRGLAVAAVRGAVAGVPFSDGTFRAAALDALAPALVEDAVRTVTAGGRVLGAIALARPAGVSEIARDATEWVGERRAAVPLVPLGRAAYSSPA